MIKSVQPIRTCISCRGKFNQDSLIRLVNYRGKILLNPDKLMPGKGLYLCDNPSCISKVFNSKIFNKVCKMQVDTNNIYEELISKFSL